MTKTYEFWCHSPEKHNDLLSTVLKEIAENCSSAEFITAGMIKESLNKGDFVGPWEFEDQADLEVSLIIRKFNHFECRSKICISFRDTEASFWLEQETLWIKVVASSMEGMRNMADQPAPYYGYAFRIECK